MMLVACSRRRAGRVPWQGESEVENDNEGASPTLEVLEANGEKLLKTILDAAANEWVRHLHAGLGGAA
jgi:hypothetical protein